MRLELMPINTDIKSTFKEIRATSTSTENSKNLSTGVGELDFGHIKAIENKLQKPEGSWFESFVLAGYSEEKARKLSGTIPYTEECKNYMYNILAMELDTSRYSALREIMKVALLSEEDLIRYKDSNISAYPLSEKMSAIKTVLSIGAKESSGQPPPSDRSVNIAIMQSEGRLGDL
jgi:hypothetical protein